jgi:hypothetical protein
MNCAQYLVIVEHKSNSDSYDSEMEDISLGESGSGASISEVENTDSDSYVLFTYSKLNNGRKLKL